MPGKIKASNLPQISIEIISDVLSSGQRLAEAAEEKSERADAKVPAVGESDALSCPGSSRSNRTNRSNISKNESNKPGVSAANSAAKKVEEVKKPPVEEKKLDFLTEIMTRKDGGSKGGAMHKAHMSYYNHMRRMKKKTNSMALTLESTNNNNTTLHLELGTGGNGVVYSINDDLECVLNENFSARGSNNGGSTLRPFRASGAPIIKAKNKSSLGSFAMSPRFEPKANGMQAAFNA